ncbi:MAG: hypothetical protein K8R67_09280 [Desulfobacteraceae bacterium]|nr:hypothetical protein [Desulfobacteraceae bacterium]
MRFCKKYVLLISFILLIIFSYAGAADRYVTTSGVDTSNDCTIPGSPCGTIDHAINGAVSGDTVKVAQGTYYENINISDSGLNPLIIQGGWDTGFTAQNTDPSVTVIDGGETDHVIYIVSSSSSTDFTIQGFKIVNGGNDSVPWGGGMSIISSGQTMSLTLNNNIIMNNTSGSSGGGLNIKAQTGGSITFIAENNRITKNETGFGGGAGIELYALNSSILTATLKNNIIANNAKETNGYGLFVQTYDSDCTVNLINNTITDNGISNFTGGGIKVSASGSSAGSVVYSTNNIVWGNAGDDILIQIWDAGPTVQVDAKYSDIGNVANNGTFPGAYNDIENNIDIDPLFQSAFIGNYHLKRASPCIGSAIFDKKIWIPAPTNTWVNYNYSDPPDDFEGDSRDSDWIEAPVNTYHKYCDMGADEWTPAVNTGMILQLLLND